MSASGISPHVKCGHREQASSTSQHVLWKITENKDTMQWFIQPDVIIQRAQCDETTQIFIIINKDHRFEILDHVRKRRARTGP